jgi:hypothetical protein
VLLVVERRGMDYVDVKTKRVVTASVRVPATGALRDALL